jgi:hypothetical protein
MFVTRTGSTSAVDNCKPLHNKHLHIPILVDIVGMHVAAFPLVASWPRRQTNAAL